MQLHFRKITEVMSDAILQAIVDGEHIDHISLTQREWEQFMSIMGLNWCDLRCDFKGDFAWFAGVKVRLEPSF